MTKQGLIISSRHAYLPYILFVFVFYFFYINFIFYFYVILIFLMLSVFLSLFAPNTGDPPLFCFCLILFLDLVGYIQCITQTKIFPANNPYFDARIAAAENIKPVRMITNPTVSINLFVGKYEFKSPVVLKNLSNSSKSRIISSIPTMEVQLHFLYKRTQFQKFYSLNQQVLLILLESCSGWTKLETFYVVSKNWNIM